MCLRCPEGGQLKPLTYLHKKEASRDGRGRHCRSCTNNYKDDEDEGDAGDEGHEGGCGTAAYCDIT